VINFLSAN
jgi:hypothetical protein